MTEADYLLHERIAIKIDGGIPEPEAIRQAEEELAPRQRNLSSDAVVIQQRDGIEAKTK